MTKELGKARADATVFQDRFMELQNSLQDKLPDGFETATAVTLKEETLGELQKDYNNLLEEYELV